MKKTAVAILLFLALIFSCKKPRGPSDVIIFTATPQAAATLTATLTATSDSTMTPVTQATASPAMTGTSEATQTLTGTAVIAAFSSTPTATQTMTRTSTPTGTVLLPNLFVSYTYLYYETVPHCLSWTANYMPKITGVYVEIQNNGTASTAAPFTVKFVNSGAEAVCTAMITPGYSRSVTLSGLGLNGGAENIMVDSNAEITESNESDNLYPFIYATATPIPTCDNSCVAPVIGFCGPGESEQMKYYSVSAGTTVTAAVYSGYPGMDLTLEYLDGCGTLKGTDSINTGVTSYYTDKFYMDGSGCPGTWTIVLKRNSAQVDTESFTATSGPAPTATMTPPCVNMPIITADPLFTVQKYKFARNGCVDMCYWNRWCTTQSGSIAFYNSADALLQVTAFSGQAQAIYRVRNTDPPGIYHIKTYDQGDTPPAVYSPLSGLGGCGAVVAGVQ